ncbi:hypothetical protein AB1Y20_002628 [Prymnesium parvum]|uniref:Calcineurin-like phosphoesterase domain-containing protein n=1 Tax=Prymnesium parvum TaxID=97485 RepID=A0AB34JC60_PRYPA
MPPPPLSFGVIADVQWADIDDGTNFDRSVARRYRGALAQLRAAAQWWQAHAPLAFVAQLGDLIDGKNAPLGQSRRALDAALELLDTVACPKVHLIGNHELYNFDREECAQRLHTARGGREFYSITPAAGVRVIVLDSFHESIILPTAGSPSSREQITRGEAYQRSLQLLQAHNPNDILSRADWTKGLVGHARRFVPYNGGLGRAQLEWFREELSAAAAARERVVVLSHAVLHPDACDGTTMAHDFEQALQAIAEHPCTVAVLCGHDHMGGYHKDEQGVHHITFQSPLNRGAEGHAYGVVTLHADRLEVRSPALGDLLPSVKLPTAQLHADDSEFVDLPFPKLNKQAEGTK